MSRFVAEYAIGKPDDFVRLVSEDFFRKEGFLPAVYKGEPVWKKGRGLLTAPQYIVLRYGQGILHIEAFLRYALLPGVYVGEMGLDGVFGFALKDTLRQRVHTLIGLLTQSLPGEAPAAPPPYTAPPSAPAYAAPVSAVPPPMNQPTADAVSPETAVPGSVPEVPAPIPVAVHNPVDKARQSLLFGLLSILGTVVSPIGITFAILGILNGRVGRMSTEKSKATAGLTLSCIFLCVSILDAIAFCVRLSLDLL